MKLTITILILFFLTSCSVKSTKKTDTDLTVKFDSVKKDEIIYQDEQLILGERIDGPANCRDSANGKILFKLNDNVLVQTAPIENKWFEIGIFLDLTGKEIKDYIILPNTDLISDGEIVGRSVDTIDIWMERDGYGFVGAYTYVDNVKKMSIPEVVLSKEIERNHLTKRELAKFIKNFDFQKNEYSDLSKFQQISIDEKFIAVQNSVERLTLLFDNNEKLIGIIHSRPINSTKFKKYNINHFYDLTIMSKLDDDMIMEIIKKRSDFYNSTN